MIGCSEGSRAAGEELAGSAPHALGWVALEQSGPWGAKAFTDSHLDPDLGRALEAVAGEHRVRPALIRRPGHHADAHAPGDRRPRTVLVASTRPVATGLLEGTVRDPGDLLGLDWAALRDGDLDAVRRSLPSLQPATGPRLLVCTNGRRDLCCAVHGRPVALAAAAAHPGRVWEVTHTSGHRFAPTAVLLPAGTLHGRLDAVAAEALLQAAERGETVLEGSRGRSTWSAAGQVAELAVRRATGETGLDALRVTDEQVAETAWAVTVTHEDGRRWLVEVESVPGPVERAESCGKPALPLRRWRTTVRAG
jgi:hypothetical protein